VKRTTQYLILLLASAPALFIGASILITNGCNPGTKKQQEQIANGKPVTIVVAQSSDRLITRELSGELQPIAEVTVLPKAAGEVKAVFGEVGDKVYAGQTLAQLDDQDYKLGFQQAEAAVTVAEAGLNQAQREFDRQERLRQDGAVSEQLYEQVKTQLEMAQAQLQQAKAARDMAKRQLEYATITSPINGKVAERYIQKGQVVAQQVPAFRIVRDDTLRLSLNVTSEDLKVLKLKQEVDVSISSSEHQIYKGKIAILPVAAEQRTGAFNVQVDVANVGKNLRAGTVGRAQLPVADLKNALMIHSDLLLMRDTGAYVMEKINGKAKLIQVEIGYKTADSLQVISGIMPGDTLINKGLKFLQDGDSVYIQAAEEEVKP